MAESHSIYLSLSLSLSLLIAEQAGPLKYGTISKSGFLFFIEEEVHWSVSLNVFRENGTFREKNIGKKEMQGAARRYMESRSIIRLLF